jgi:hypothetical protein
MARPDRTKFQRQHYLVFAELIKESKREYNHLLPHRPEDAWSPLQAIKVVEKKLSQLFLADNPRFVPSKFEEDCR